MRERHIAIHEAMLSSTGRNAVVFLFPLSAVLLSSLQCWQYISGSGLSFAWPYVEHTPLKRDTYKCDHKYTVEILSIDPVVIYLNDFLSEAEIHHLLELGASKFRPSTVSYGDEATLDQRERKSQSAYLPSRDFVCKCIQDRMKTLLGNLQHENVEGLQLVKYEAGGDKFNLHTDWQEAHVHDHLDEYGAPRASRRLGTIFVYLEDQCTRGETYFPEITAVSEAADGRKFAIAEGSKGLLVKPFRGNGIFWNNIYSNGSGDARVIHAGLPPESGVKIGLNIWSTYFFDAPFIGG